VSAGGGAAGDVVVVTAGVVLVVVVVLVGFLPLPPEPHAAVNVIKATAVAIPAVTENGRATRFWVMSVLIFYVLGQLF